MRTYQSFIDDSTRWDGFVHRPDDIVICSPSKSGTTWMQTCCALLVFGSPDAFPGRVGDFSPWLDMQLRPKADVFARYEAQTHRRIIKTHTPLDGLPFDERVTYVTVARDPRDVVLSWDDHLANMDLEKAFELRVAAVGMAGLDGEVPTAPLPPPPDDPAERFWAAITDRSSDSGAATNLHAVLNHHLQTWTRRDRPNVARFHYADLLADLPAELRRLAEILGVEVDEDRFPDQVAAARFDAMKERAADALPEGDLATMWTDTGEFFKSARRGAWQGLLSAERLAEYDRLVLDAVGPELGRWIHEGAAGGA